MNGDPLNRGARRARWLALLVLLAVGAFGVAAGVVLDRSALLGVSGPFGPPRDREHRRGPGGLQRRWERMAKDLGLTPPQAAHIDSVLAQESRRLDAVRAEVEPRMKEIMDEMRQRIDSVLTPEQRNRLEALRREHESRRGRR